MPQLGMNIRNKCGKLVYYIFGAVYYLLRNAAILPYFSNDTKSNNLLDKCGKS